MGDQLQERLRALERLHRVHLADRDALPLAEAQERLAVAREQPPDGLLAVAVEVTVDPDLAGDRAPDRLVVLRPVVVFPRHGGGGMPPGWVGRWPCPLRPP